jgi:hypothetical protein
MKKESFKAQNTDELVWLRLNALRSVKLCENMIKCKLESCPNPLITDDIIKNKAIGLSSAIDSAIGYWQINPKLINAKVLSRYYFLLQMTFAEEVSSVKTINGLKEIQKQTENGHGLSTISDSTRDFPDNYYTLTLKSGHFNSYAKSLGINTKEFDFEKRPRKFSEITDLFKIVNLTDLFRRIPELGNVIEEYTNQPPLNLHIGYSNKNMEGNPFIEESPSHNSTQKSTYISIFNKSPKITIEFINSLGLQFTDFEYTTDTFTNERYINCKLAHDISTIWHQHLKIYSSDYAPTTLIVPLWGKISDNIMINFILLYTLSIIVRYLPDLWYRIYSGDLNHIGSLIEYYISIIDHILPHQMLERITGKEIFIHQPGSMFGPV